MAEEKKSKLLSIPVKLFDEMEYIAKNEGRSLQNLMIRIFSFYASQFKKNNLVLYCEEVIEISEEKKSKILSIPIGLFGELEGIAKSEGRSLQNLMIRMFFAYVEQYKKNNN